MTVQELYRKSENAMPWMKFIIRDTKTGEEMTFRNEMEIRPIKLKSREVKTFRFSEDFKVLTIVIE